jgi:hypothetical protein
MEDVIRITKSEVFIVRLEPSLKKAVVERAKREGMSAAAIIRMSVRAFIDSDKKNGKHRDSARRSPSTRAAPR